MYGSALYPYTFDCQIDASMDNFSKLSKIEIWTHTFYA